MSFLSSLSSLSVCLIFVSIQSLYSTSLPVTLLCRCVLLHSTLHAWPRVIVTKIETETWLFHCNHSVQTEQHGSSHLTWLLTGYMSMKSQPNPALESLPFLSLSQLPPPPFFLLSFFFYLLTANLSLPFPPLPFLLPIKDLISQPEHSQLHQGYRLKKGFLLWLLPSLPPSLLLSPMFLCVVVVF